MANAAKISIGLTGADAVASGLETVKGSVRGVKSELASMGLDALRTATALKTINFAAAAEQAKEYDLTLARMSARSGSGVEALSTRFAGLSKEILVGQRQQADFARSLGRVTGDAKGSVEALRGLGTAALAAGRTLDDNLEVGAGLRQGLGVVGDTTEALGKLRSQADAAGIDWVNFTDAITSSKGALEQVGLQADGTKDKMTALAAVLGKGFSREGQARVTAGVVGTLQGRALDIERMLGHRILDDQGHLKDPAKVQQEIKERVERRLGKGTEASRRALISSYGPEVGSAIFNSDLSTVGKVATATGGAAKIQAEANAVKASQAGQALRQDAARQNAELEVGRGLNGVKRGLFGQFTGLLEDHPIAGLLGLSAGQAGVQAGAQSLFRRIIGGSTEAATEGGAVAANALKGAAPAVAEKALTVGEAQAELASAQLFGKAGASYAAKGLLGKAASFVPVLGQAYELGKFQLQGVESLGKDSEFAKERREQVAKAAAAEVGGEAIRRGRLDVDLFKKAGTVEGGQAELIKYLARIADSLPPDLAKQIAEATAEENRKNHALVSPAQATEIAKNNTPKP